MADSKVFYSPCSFGCFSLGTERQNKSMTFNLTAPVLSTAVISIIFNEQVVKRFVDGDGLTLSNLNQTVTLILNGADFSQFAGETLKGNVSFVELGAVEMTFDLKIIKTLL